MADLPKVYKKDWRAIQQQKQCSGRQARKEAAWDYFDRRWFYTVRSLFGYNDVFFYLLLGGRDSGKSYAVMDRFLRDWRRHGIPFYWLRLTDRIAQSMLQNNAAKMFDADLRRKYELDPVVKGCEVFNREPDGSLVKLAEVMGISNFYNMKGTATFDCEWKKGYNICLDECQREVGEAVRFDLSYALVNTLENYVRDTKEKLRIVFICNYTETVSDVMNLFNFIPEKFGRYHLAAKKAVVEYMPITSGYASRRNETVADILMANASTFTNQKAFDKSLLKPKNVRLWKPVLVIDFGAPDEIYTAWSSKNCDAYVIKMWNHEKIPNVVAMKPNLDGRSYSRERVKNVVDLFDKRAWKFENLITQQRFGVSIAKIRKSK